MPLITYDDALTQLLTLAAPTTTETAPLAHAAGRVLASDLRADRDLPPFNRAAMDGYAVRLAQIQPHAQYPVVSTLAAGGPPEGSSEDLTKRIKPGVGDASGGGGTSGGGGGVVRIATGASVPLEYDAVIPIERAEVLDEGRAVRFPSGGVREGFAVHLRGADAKTGDTLIAAGTALKPHHLGIAASAGVTQLPVYRRPRVVVLSTGDELLPPETATEDLAPQQIRNSNGPMLCALAQAAGAQVIRHEHLVDELNATLDGANRALNDADLVLTSGGVSVGDRDHLPAAWQQIGVETLLHGVAIQPGKPVLIACAKESAVTILGLPGNPVSVLATFHLFAWPWLRAQSGIRSRLPWQKVTLIDSVQPKTKRELFRAVTVDGHHRATLLAWQGSGDLAHTSPMHGFIRLPQQDAQIPAGSQVSFLPVLDA